MIVGCPREIKNHEYRVGLTPAGAHALTVAGHSVLMEHDAGARVGFDDSGYLAAGAQIVGGPEEVYERAALLIKVKELQAAEFALTQPGQILYCYQHLAPDSELLQHMLDARVSCIAFETVSDLSGNLPLLAPMSRIAGRLAPQMGAWALQMANGGSGVLLGGVPGVLPASIVVIGAGSVGANATQIAVGMGADVTVFDCNVERLETIDRLYRGRVKTAATDALGLAAAVRAADLVVGAVLIPGKLSPKLISRRLLSQMRPGSVIIDVGIDQGGISEASKPTTHSDPLFVAEGVIHYCVPNMPSAVARTATLALMQATLPHALALAELGLQKAVARDMGLAQGLQTHAGSVTHEGLAQDVGRPWLDPADAIARS
jgi:alanine dehydrogenase